MQASSLDFDVITGPSVPRDPREAPQGIGQGTDRNPPAQPAGPLPALPRTR
jgi:hypothetical protein